MKSKIISLLFFMLFSISAYANSLVLLETNMGNIVIELYDKEAPKTSANFLAYVEDGFYNGTIFHRVIDGFMIQGGGYDSKFKEKITRAPIQNEASNGLKNVRGSVAMARTADPNSASSQFFINLVDNPYLDYRNNTVEGFGYAVFGKVVEGMDVVDLIGKQKTGRAAGHSDVPQKTIVIKDAKVLFEEDKK